MRLIKVLLICLLLTSCAKSYDIGKALDRVFSDTDGKDVLFNNYSKYIDYYKSTDLYEEDANDLSFVFVLDDSKFIMNINVAGIINTQYYQQYALSDDGFFDDSKLVYSKSYYFINKDNKQVNYFFNLYQYGDRYILYFVDEFVNFYGYCNESEVKLLAGKIFDMAKSVQVDTAGILTNYSSRDVIEYHKSTVNLFETIMPVEGRIDDLMIDTNENVSE